MSSRLMEILLSLNQLVSDNSPQFSSKEYKIFLKYNGNKHFILLLITRWWMMWQRDLYKPWRNQLWQEGEMIGLISTTRNILTIKAYWSKSIVLPFSGNVLGVLSEYQLCALKLKYTSDYILRILNFDLTSNTIICYILVSWIHENLL